IQRAGEELLSAPSGAAPDDGPLGAERAALADAKKLLLVVAGSAARRFGEGLAEQQEMLGALADLAIGLFAAESAVLRAARLHESGGGPRALLAEQMARVFAEE